MGSLTPCTFSGIHISNCITCSFEIKVSRSVINIVPSRLSYTIPIQGLFAWGARIYFGTDIISLISAMVSKL